MTGVEKANEVDLLARGGLSAAELERYRRDGFLKLEGFASKAACEALIARSAELCAAFDPAEAMSIFSTKEQTRTTDTYFLESGDKIRFFLEEGAVDASGALRAPKERAINKIGHALHDLDPLFSTFSRDPRLAAISAAIGVRDPRLVQSMYIFKQPGIGGEVGCHQDATFLYTDPMSVVGFWFALEDATLENGCLWAIPGGHRDGLKSRFVRDGEGRTRMNILDPTPWPLDRLVPLEAPQGTLIVLHGLLPHRSDANTSPRSRHAYAVHVIDGATSYPPDNWLKRSEKLPLRGFSTHE
jgi:phytanoyl-CoA hydroxylase